MDHVTVCQYLEDFARKRFNDLLEKLGLVKILLHDCIIAEVVLCSLTGFCTLFRLTFEDGSQGFKYF